MHHPLPDPNVCPHCGAADTLRELDRPLRWQPVRLAYPEAEHPNDGRATVPAPIDYPDTWTVSDDGEQTSYECGDCYAGWTTLGELAHAQRLAHALTRHRDHWETRAERLRTLDDAGRLDTVTAAERIEYADGMAHGFAHALAILRGNGEA